MDVNPTFGHQELFESMSLTSKKSDSQTSTSDARTKRGSSSGSSRGQQQQKSSPGAAAAAAAATTSGGGLRTTTLLESSMGSQQHMDEAYRRLGQRLSHQAHGDTTNTAASVTSSLTGKTAGPLSVTPWMPAEESGGAFQKYRLYLEEQQQQQVDEDEPTHRQPLDAAKATTQHHHESPARLNSSTYRHNKVAKMRYSDHGDHHPKNNDTRQHHFQINNILRRLTVGGREAYLLWEQAERQKQRQHDPTASTSRRRGDTRLSPQRYAFSQLALAEGTDRFGQARNNMMIGSSNNSKGLLSSVLEGHSDSNTDTSAPAVASRYSSPSLSVSTKETPSSIGAGSAGGNSGTVGGGPHQSQKRGTCLTNPSDPVANDGLDNVEGNLIVCENDRIRVPRKSLHTTGGGGGDQHHNNNNNNNNTNNNKWKHGKAEFRVQGLLGQGTFAQVFKSLHVQTGQTLAIKIVKNKPAYTRQASVEIDIFRALKENGTSALPISEGCMVELVCYFVYKSHLCLVFELLGQNLYEILKRRQFRGLPLTIVREIVQQAVMGIRELAQKNIVHCDLKPENVLLVSDNAANELVAAGEGRRRLPTHHQQGGTTAAAAMLSSSSNSVALSVGTSKDTVSKDATTRDTSSGSSATLRIFNRHTVTSEDIPETHATEDKPRGKIKLIDFGSACFEGFTAHTYIQSRFYRSPEVLVGVPYDTVVDIWSLGCVAAELFLGLPILPGVHEHDQLGRIHEMIAKIPDWMLDQGSKATKFYVKYVPRPVETSSAASPRQSGDGTRASPAPPLPQWRLKTQREYISSLSKGEIRKKGGLAKLEKQPGNRYFKRRGLADILFLHGQSMVGPEKELVPAFVHFLYGLLDPDPWKRWTAFQAMQHPFVTGDLGELRKKRPDLQLDPKEENQANLELDVYWEAPWDPSICRRKLLNVQKLREKQQSMRRSGVGRPAAPVQGGTSSLDPAAMFDRRRSRRNEPSSPLSAVQQGATPLSMDANPPSRSGDSAPSPPFQISPGGPSITHRSRASFDGIVVGSMGSGQPASTSLRQSFSQQGQVMIGADQTFLAPPPAPTVSGAQSFTGLDRTVAQLPIEGDFAQALQRPGVVPGTGVDHSLPGSYQGAWSVGHGSSAGTQTATTVPSTTTSSALQFPPGGPSQTVLLNQPAYSSSSGTPDHSLPGQGTAAHGGLANMPPVPFGNQFGDGAVSSVSSSITLPEGTTMDQHHLSQQLLLQQQTTLLKQQRQEFFGVGSQRLVGGQPGNFALPQQQVFLASAPGGGQYYVTTSPAGQPIVLQPVAFLDPNMSNHPGTAVANLPPDVTLPMTGVSQQQFMPPQQTTFQQRPPQPFQQQQLFQQPQQTFQLQQQPQHQMLQQPQLQQQPVMYPPERGWNQRRRGRGSMLKREGTSM